MPSHKRRQSTAAFRHAAVRLLTEQGDGGTAAARNLGLKAPMGGRWQRQGVPQSHGGSRGTGPLSAAQAALLQGRPAVKQRRRAHALGKQAALCFASASR